MGNYKVAINFFGLFLVALILYFAFSRSYPKNISLIHDFKSCVQAGNAVTQTNPPECRGPDGEVYLEEVFLTQQCASDQECGSGKFCDSGKCQDFVVNSSCTADSDCKLVNEDLNFGCCWAGVCQPIDYSDANWVAVNEKWFSGNRTQVCASAPACGPRPACPDDLVNDSFEARCVAGLCEKLPIRQ